MNPNGNQSLPSPAANGVPQYGAAPPAPGPVAPYGGYPIASQPASGAQPNAMPPAQSYGGYQQPAPASGATYAGVPQRQPAAPYPAQPQPAQPAPVVQGTGGSPAPGQPGQNAAVHPVAAHTNPNSTQNMLQIAEIRDGIVIMNDGSFRSVVMVKSINFDLMSQQEQEAIEYSYQGFLNSLYFPIQIFIRSQKVDLQPYIDKLDKIRTEHENMLLALLMEDYINYIDQLSQQTNIMDKKFYIVIPFFPHVDVQKALSQSKNFINGLVGLFSSKDQHVVINEKDLEAAKTELRNRVQAVLSGLLQAGIQGLPLDTQELIELFYDTYNPDTATRQELKNFGTLNADIVTKGQGAAPQAHLQRELG